MIEKLAALALLCPQMKIEDFFSLRNNCLYSTSQVLAFEKLSIGLKSYVRAHSNFFQEASCLLEEIERVGARFTFPGKSDYPKSLLSTPYPPVALTYFGADVWNRFPLLPVVGSRDASQCSYEWMDYHLAEIIKLKNVVTVSGGARGIDQRAHGVSLRLERPTVVFLPAGLLCLYPSELADWIQPIVEFGGAVVSEFSLQQPMFKSHFYRRNRMIAGISDTLLVVEAKNRGGSMMTANWALDQGKSVCTLPGFPGDERFAGNNQLLFDGAEMVVGYQQLLDLI